MKGESGPKTRSAVVKGKTCPHIGHCFSVCQSTVVFELQNVANIRILRLAINIKTSQILSLCKIETLQVKECYKIHTAANLKMPKISKCLECAVLFLLFSYIFLLLSYFYQFFKKYLKSYFFLLFHIAVLDGPCALLSVYWQKSLANLAQVEIFLLAK